MSVRRSSRLLNLKRNQTTTREDASKDSDEGTDEDRSSSASDSGDEEYGQNTAVHGACSSGEDSPPVKQAKLVKAPSESSGDQFELDSLTVDLSDLSSGDDDTRRDAELRKASKARAASTNKVRRKNLLAAVQRNLNNAASGSPRLVDRVVESTHASFAKAEVASDDGPSTSQPAAASGEDLRDAIAAMLHENEVGGHHSHSRRSRAGNPNAVPSTSSQKTSIQGPKGPRDEKIRKGASPKGRKVKPAIKRPRTPVDDSTSGSDWEEVSQETPAIPANGVVITLQPHERKQKKAGFDPAAYLKRELNRARRELRVVTHKVHLLCLLAHGLHLERVLADRTLQATALSLLSPEFLAYSGRAVTFLDIDRFIKMYCRHFSCKLASVQATRTLVDDLTGALLNRLAQCARDYALMFIVILRCLNIEARLCVSLYPVPLDVEESTVQGSKNNNGPHRKKKAHKATKGLKKSRYQEPEDSSDEVDQPDHKSSPSPTRKRGCKTAKGPKKRECPDKGQESLSEDKVEHWAEVFTPKDSKWISVDVVHGCAGDVSQIRQPLLYVLGFQDGCAKELTAKYCSGRLPKKSRVREDWWQQSLLPFRPSPSERDLLEDRQLESRLLKQPMPSSIAEFKGHPVYVLRRHLLKYEALYPADLPPLGFVRGEAVYARECVHVLRSREAWLREARMVRLREEPYKRVKGRAKKDLASGLWSRLCTRTACSTGYRELDLFGLWQTEPYMPPIAFGGKVPRNEWGNVELFKSCMLPVGTVHLRAPALGRVAAKLNIDCVPAVVGFEGHGRGVHPVFDGWVVCEEFADTLMMAWREEQANISNRQEEASAPPSLSKRQKRVFGNWRRLIKGVLIRAHLRDKYLGGDGDDG
ncbi:unnamed protein product [Ixodes hexagonus]